MTNANQQRIPTVPLKSLTAENHYATRIATAAHANNANGPPPPFHTHPVSLANRYLLQPQSLGGSLPRNWATSSRPFLPWPAH